MSCAESTTKIARITFIQRFRACAPSDCTLMIDNRTYPCWISRRFLEFSVSAQLCQYCVRLSDRMFFFLPPPRDVVYQQFSAQNVPAPSVYYERLPQKLRSETAAGTAHERRKCNAIAVSRRNEYAFVYSGVVLCFFVRFTVFVYSV